MKRFQPHAILVAPFLLMALAAGGTACDRAPATTGTQENKDRAAVDRQQSQYAKGQPIPAFDWSLERDLLVQLYNLRNQKVTTHAVWRSDMGMVEGDCASLGFGLPYDTSLTNPHKSEWRTVDDGTGISNASAVIGQAEPNGIFASTNTSATWIMCVDATGNVMPTYVEAKVTVYPQPMLVDYTTNRVTAAVGGTPVTLNVK